MNLEFSGEVWFCRGPSPFHVVTVPEPESAEIRSAAEGIGVGDTVTVSVGLTV